MQTGSVLTLNFYSNPLDVMLGDDRTIYINWKHYCDMIGNDPEVPPHIIIRGEFDVDYIAFSYVVNNVDDLVYGHPDELFANLIREEFPGYIIRELGLIRTMIPMIDLPYPVYDAGVFQHEGQMFVLMDKLERFTNINPVIPGDVPRFPIMLTVQMPATGFTPYRRDRPKSKTAYPTWMVEMSSLPYIIEESYANFQPFKTMTNDYGMAVSVPKDSEMGQKLQEHFDSHTNKLEVYEEPMTWAGTGLQIKPEL